MRYVAFENESRLISIETGSLRPSPFQQKLKVDMICTSERDLMILDWMLFKRLSQRNLTGSKISMSSTKFVFLRYIAKRHFWLLWNGFNETWQEGRSQRPLQSLCFSIRLIGKTRWLPGLSFMIGLCFWGRSENNIAAQPLIGKEILWQNVLGFLARLHFSAEELLYRRRPRQHPHAKC